MGVRTKQLAVRTSLVGYYRNAVTLDEDGALAGYRLYLGADAGFDYRHKIDRPGEDWDLLATVGTGPSADLELLTHDLLIDAGVDAAVQTGMVRPWAYDAWRAMNPNAVVRGSIQTNEHGYYHGYGVAIEPRLAINFHHATLGASLGEGMYRAFHGHDRYDRVFTADPQLVDHDATAAAWLGVTLGRAVLRFDVTTRARSGRADAFQAASSDRSAVASIGFRL
jgi:hypothetical protein